MKSYIQTIALLLLAFTTIPTNAQGLEKIVVEKYYISTDKDIAKTGGVLPKGSVTYRIYVDMLPGYRFQAAFGIPGHELKIATTTTFFNNEDYGSIIPTVIPYRNIGNNTVMLDSWLTAGAACEGNWGVLKSDDDENNTVVNKDNLLQNENPAAGIPLKARDGFYNGVAPRITFFGIDSLAKQLFGNTNTSTAPTVFSTENGSWATLEGTNGPTPENRVLIAQLTTNGILSFELNIQIGRPGEGVERYVAKNPSGDEIVLKSLIYNSSLN
ncbi:MAG: hypothetical protein ABI772_15110 [Bacteroidota bacterium]